MTSSIFIDSSHLLLFAQLMHSGRVSIRGNNPQMGKWLELETLGFCSVLESGRAGIFVIHNTMKAHGLAESFISMMEPNGEASQQVQGDLVQYTNAQIHGSKFEGWQCFHCGEVFTTVGGARDHFGADPNKEPGCLIKVKVGDERGLEMELRKVEAERDTLRFQIANGTTEIENSVQEMLTNHRIALRHAEEDGYKKGLDDGRKLAMPTPNQEPVRSELIGYIDLPNREFLRNGINATIQPTAEFMRSRIPVYIGSAPARAAAIPECVKELVNCCRKICFPMVTKSSADEVDAMQEALKNVEAALSAAPKPADKQ